VEISLNSLIDRQNNQLGEFLNRQIEGQTVTGLDGIISQAKQHLDDLNNRLESRRRELELERHCAVADISHLGRAWIVPHPERTSPHIAPMVRDDEIEHLAVQLAIAHEAARGWVVESVESENRGFDLISRRPHPEAPRRSSRSGSLRSKAAQAWESLRSVRMSTKRPFGSRATTGFTSPSTAAARLSCTPSRIPLSLAGSRSWPLSTIALDVRRSWRDGNDDPFPSR
jgi:hypothetical protein